MANTCSLNPEESGVRLKSKITAAAVKVKSVSRLSHYPDFAILAFPCLHLRLGCDVDSDQFRVLAPHSKCSSAMVGRSMWQWIKAACACHEHKKTVLISWFKISLLEYMWTYDPQKDSKPYQNVGKLLEKDWAGSSTGISDQIAFSFSADV